MEKLEQKVSNKDKNHVKEFFKPTLAELALMLWEAPLLSLPIAGLTYATTKDPIRSAVYATIPEALTYAGMRAYEMFGKDKYIQNLIRKQKYPLV